MRKKITNLLGNKSKFLQASWLGIGNSFGSIINILLMIVVSRLLLKGDYGTFRQMIYIHVTLISVVGVSLSKVSSNYLPLLSLEKGKNLVRKILLILIGVGAFFAIILLIFNPLVCQFFNNPELKNPLYVFSGIIFFTIPTLGIEGIYATYKKTHVFGIYTIINKLLLFILLIIPLFLKPSDLNYLVLFWLIQSGFSFLLGIYLMYKPFIKVTAENSDISFSRIYTFILPLILSSILGILFTASDQYFISNYFGKEVYADFSNGSIQIPFIGILIGSIGSILHPYFIEKINTIGGKQEIVETIKNSILKSVVLIYPLVIFIWFSSDEIFSILFDEIYKDSSSFFKVISIYNLFSVFVLLPIIIALQEVKFYNIIHILAVLFVWTLQWLGLSLFNNPLIIPIVSIFIKVMMIVALIVKIAVRLNVSYTKMIPIKKIIGLTLSCIITLLPFTFLKQFFEKNMFQILLYLIISFILYYFIILNINKNFKTQLKLIISQFTSTK